LQEEYNRNYVKEFDEGIWKIKKSFQPRTTMCRNKQGIMVGDESEVLEVWAEYFKELLNPQINVLTNSVAQEPKGSSPHSQQPATGPCPETVESNPHPPSQSP
jgi:hypothetical protein